MENNNIPATVAKKVLLSYSIDGKSIDKGDGILNIRTTEIPPTISQHNSKNSFYHERKFQQTNQW